MIGNCKYLESNKEKKDRPAAVLGGRLMIDIDSINWYDNLGNRIWLVQHDI